MKERRQSRQKHRRVIFFGTPEFALPTLQLLAKNGAFEIFVVTAPAKPAGKSGVITPSPIKILSDNLGLLTFEPERLRDPDFFKKIASLKPELFVVAAYGKIIPQELLDIVPDGSINIHPSLLPKYRGPSPIEAAILAGEKETGVTIMLMDAEIDHGPVLAEEIVLVKENETAPELSKRLAKIGAKLLLNTLPRWFLGEIAATPQDHERATYTKRLEREDGRLYWDNPADLLLRQVRAYAGWPESHFIWMRNNEALRVKVEAARIISSGGGERSYGTVWQAADAPIAIETLDGALAVDKLRLQGKASRTATEFINGYPDIIGAKLL